MNKLFSKNQKGIGLIEVLLAISMAGIIIVSVGQSLASMHKLTARSEINDQALSYAKESMEIITALKNDYFFTDFTAQANYQAIDPDLEADSLYTRSETIEKYCHDESGSIISCPTEINDSEKVTIAINYDGQKRAELTTVFTNWRQQTP